jgi:hypothetical protein
MLSYKYERDNIIIKSDRSLSHSDINDMLVPASSQSISFMHVGNCIYPNNLLFQPVDFTGTLTCSKNTKRIYMNIVDGKFRPSLKIPAIDVKDSYYKTHFFFDEDNQLNHVHTSSNSADVYETFEKKIKLESSKIDGTLMRSTSTVLLNDEIFIPVKPLTMVQKFRNSKEHIFPYNGRYIKDFDEFAKKWLKEHNKDINCLDQSDYDIMHFEYKLERKKYAISV